MSIKGALGIIKEFLGATNIYSQEEVMTLIWPCLLGHLQKCIFLILIHWMAFILLYIAFICRAFIDFLLNGLII